MGDAGAIIFGSVLQRHLAEVVVQCASLGWNIVDFLSMIKSKSSLGWQGPLKVIQSKPPVMSKASSTRSGSSEPHVNPEVFQGWGIYVVSGQPVSVFHHLNCRKFLLYI